MLSNINYFERCAGKGTYVVCEMDTEYNFRSERILGANPTNDAYSVAKLFVVTAVGICVDRGLMSTEDNFLKLMEMELPEGCDEKWKNVTIHMLLKHKAGLSEGFLDIDTENASEYPTDDYLSMVLSRPLPLEQGVERTYSDAAFYLLSRAVEKVCGLTVFELLRKPLMSVMRFGEYAWSTCPEGHTIGATGLYVRCEDMVKLGVLYLNGGEWKGERIISEEWCRTVFERQYELAEVEGGWYRKGGMRGQMLALHPEKKIAVAWMGYSRGLKFGDILY